jgi:hypothetical protein
VNRFFITLISGCGTAVLMEKGVDSIDALVPTLVWCSFTRTNEGFVKDEGYSKDGGFFVRLAYECATAENGIFRLDVSRWFFDQAGIPIYRGTRCMLDPQGIEGYGWLGIGRWPVVTCVPKRISVPGSATPGSIVHRYIASDGNDEKIKKIKEYAVERMGCVFSGDYR